MGRKMNGLKNDDRPLTAFVVDLRALWEEQGSPSLTRLATKAGYGQPRLSELFNAKRIPDESLLDDVVAALGGDDKEKVEQLRAEWAARLQRLIKEERDYRDAAARNGDSPEAQIARLEDEIKRLTAIAEHPDSVIAQAAVAEALAAQRIAGAAALEREARALLKQADDQFRLLHDRMPAMQKQATSIIADAVTKATRYELEGRKLQDHIVAQAHRRADDIVKGAEAKAIEIMQNSEKHAKDHRSNAYQSVSKMLQEVDQLRVEADQAVKHAEAQRARLQMRAKIEIEQLVREAQRHLEKAGVTDQVHALELLLVDFNIVGSHAGARGRHAKTSLPDEAPGPADPEAADRVELIVLPPGGGRQGWTFPQPRS